jgi:hypothetical protein
VIQSDSEGLSTGMVGFLVRQFEHFIQWSISGQGKEVHATVFCTKLASSMANRSG